MTPFNEKDPERDYKVAGKTGIVCTLDDQPIYRKAFYTLNMEAYDVTVGHNNTEAIRAEYNAQKEKETDGITADNAFQL